MYILIVILTFSGGTSFSQEFDSKKTCEDAKKDIRIQLNTRSYSVIGCYAK